MAWHHENQSTKVITSKLVTSRKANQHKMTNANNANKGELVNDNMRRMIVFPPALPTVAEDEGGIRPICRGFASASAGASPRQ